MKTRALATAIVVLSLVAYLPFAPLRFSDFRAFYCAGSAIAAHADPYREHPLHDCERALRAPGMPADRDDVTLPAPLPGFALAAFALLTPLGFTPAAVVWLLGSILAVALNAELLARSLGIGRVAALIVVGLPAAIVAIPLGQVTPIVGLGIALCAFALRHQQPRLAALGALLTAIEPPIALAICSALFLGVAQTRVWLLAGTGALIAASMAGLGPDVNLEYLTKVLHAHALANVGDRTQFSVSHFAWALGFDRSVALALGSGWYLLALATGVWLALRLRPQYGAVTLALVPPAFAVFGGLYVHFAQVALAVPAFVLIAARRTHGRARLCASIFIVAVPWLAITAFPVFAGALAVCAVAFCRAMGLRYLGPRLALWCAEILLTLFGIALGTLGGAADAIAVSVNGNPLADVSWQRFEAIREAHPSACILLLQMPTVLAFTVCLAAVVRAALPRRAPAIAPNPLRASGR